MKHTIFMLSILAAFITGAVLTTYYIDTKCEKKNEITSVKTINDSIKITNNK